MSARRLCRRGCAHPLLQRLVYLSSGMHHGGRPVVAGLHWSGRRATSSYSDSKLLVTTLAMAVARRRPDVVSNAVDPLDERFQDDLLAALAVFTGVPL